MGPDFPNAEYFQIRELTPGIWDLDESVKMPDVIPKIYKVLLNQTNWKGTSKIYLGSFALFPWIRQEIICNKL